MLTLMRDRTAALGLILYLVLVVVAVFAGQLAPYDPTAIHMGDRLKAPSVAYLLGTVELGRDLLSRIILGARVSMSVGFVSVGIGCTLGVMLGLVAGYKGGVADSVIMRALDGVLAFPSIILAMAIVSALGPSVFNAMIAIGVVSIPTFARITRGSVLSLREKEFVEAVPVDKYTVKLALKAASASFPSQVGDLRIVPKDFDPAKPVGTGPFQYVEWVRNQRIRLKKFADYHMKGLPYLDEVVFQPVPDEDQKIVLLQTGQVDFADTIPLPRVKEVQQGGKIQLVTVPAGVSPSSYWMDCNTKWAPLNDARVRRALNYAIDRKAVLDVTFGVGTLKSSLVPPKHWAFNPNALSFNERDVQKAKQLLAEAGLANGFSVQLKQITSRAEFATIAQLIQSNLADVGVKVEIIPLDLGVWVEQTNKGDFQLTLTGLTPLYDPDPLLSRPYKLSGWKNEEFDKLLAQGRATANQEERKKIYGRAQEIAQEESPCFVVNERPILYGASPKVQNFKADLRSHTHFREVWLKQ